MRLEQEPPYVKGRQRADICGQHTTDSVLLATIKNNAKPNLDSVPIPCYVPEPLHQSSLLTHVVYQYVQQ